MVFHWSLSDSKSPHVSRTLLNCSYLWVSHTDDSWWLFTGVWVTVSLLRSPGLFWVFLSILNNAVVWMVSILHLISNSFSLSSKLLGTVARASTIIGITFTLIFQRLFEFSGKVQVFVLSFCFLLTSPCELLRLQNILVNKLSLLVN